MTTIKKKALLAFSLSLSISLSFSGRRGVHERELTRASSRKLAEVGWVNKEAVCVSAEDWRSGEAAAIGGDVGSGDGLGGALLAAVDAQGDGVKALGEVRRSGIGTDGGGKEDGDGGELHFEKAVWE